MSLQHIQKNSPRLLPKPAKFEKNPPNGYRVIRKTKCGAGGAAGAGGAGSSPIHKQASLAGRLIMYVSGFSVPNTWTDFFSCNCLLTNPLGVTTHLSGVMTYLVYCFLNTTMTNWDSQVILICCASWEFRPIFLVA